MSEVESGESKVIKQDQVEIVPEKHPDQIFRGKVPKSPYEAAQRFTARLEEVWPGATPDERERIFPQLSSETYEMTLKEIKSVRFQYVREHTLTRLFGDQYPDEQTKYREGLFLEENPLDVWGGEAPISREEAIKRAGEFWERTAPEQRYKHFPMIAQQTGLKLEPGEQPQYFIPPDSKWESVVRYADVVDRNLIETFGHALGPYYYPWEVEPEFSVPEVKGLSQSEVKTVAGARILSLTDRTGYVIKSRDLGKQRDHPTWLDIEVSVAGIAKAQLQERLDAQLDAEKLAKFQSVYHLEAASGKQCRNVRTNMIIERAARISSEEIEEATVRAAEQYSVYKERSELHGDYVHSFRKYLVESLSYPPSTAELIIDQNRLNGIENQRIREKGNLVESVSAQEKAERAVEALTIRLKQIDFYLSEATTQIDDKMPIEELSQKAKERRKFIKQSAALLGMASLAVPTGMGLRVAYDALLNVDKIDGDSADDQSEATSKEKKGETDESTDQSPGVGTDLIKSEESELPLVLNARPHQPKFAEGRDDQPIGTAVSVERSNDYLDTRAPQPESIKPSDRENGVLGKWVREAVTEVVEPGYGLNNITVLPPEAFSLAREKFTPDGKGIFKIKPMLDSEQVAGEEATDKEVAERLYRRKEADLSERFTRANNFLGREFGVNLSVTHWDLLTYVEDRYDQFRTDPHALSYSSAFDPTTKEVDEICSVFGGIMGDEPPASFEDFENVNKLTWYRPPERSSEGFFAGMTHLVWQEENCGRGNKAWLGHGDDMPVYGEGAAKPLFYIPDKNGKIDPERNGFYWATSVPIKGQDDELRVVSFRNDVIDPDTKVVTTIGKQVLRVPCNFAANDTYANVAIGMAITTEIMIDVAEDMEKEVESNGKYKSHYKEVFDYLRKTKPKEMFVSFEGRATDEISDRDIFKAMVYAFYHYGKRSYDSNIRYGEIGESLRGGNSEDERAVAVGELLMDTSWGKALRVGLRSSVYPEWRQDEFVGPGRTPYSRGQDFYYYYEIPQSRREQARKEAEEAREQHPRLLELLEYYERLHSDMTRTPETELEMVEVGAEISRLVLTDDDLWHFVGERIKHQESLYRSDSSDIDSWFQVSIDPRMRLARSNLQEYLADEMVWKEMLSRIYLDREELGEEAEFLLNDLPGVLVDLLSTRITEERMGRYCFASWASWSKTLSSLSSKDYLDEIYSSVDKT